MENTEKFEISTTQRGKRKIICDGFTFVKKKNLAGDKELFECTKRREHPICYATLCFKDDDIISQKNSHSHAPDAAKNEASKIRETIKARASETVESPQQILQHVVKDLSLDNAGNVTSMENQKRYIRSVRGSNTGSDEPSEVTKIIEMKRFMDDGNDFLLYNSYEHQNRDKNQMVIFGTVQSVDHLKESKHWFADGTFDIAPTSHYQLYSIHCSHNNRVFPCVYAILSNKKQSMYEDLFAQLKEYCAENEPESITFDFELAAINAASIIFPSSNLNGCFFHLSQSFYRKIQQLGLQKKYGSDASFANKCKMIPAMAFIPLDEVEPVFEELKSHLSDDGFKELLSYFEINYVGVSSPKQNPKYKTKFWNVTAQVANEVPKTNNYVEGCHNRMKHATSCTHPTLGALIHVLKKEHQITNFLIIHSDMKVERVRNKVYSKKADRVKTMLQDYKKYRPIYYLQLIASTLKL